MNIGQENGKFVAPHAADQITGPHTVAQSASNRDQRLITCLMSLAIIDRLETIKIDQQDTCHLARATLCLGKLVPAFLQHAAIGKLSQDVLESILPQGLLGDPAIGNIVKYHNTDAHFMQKNTAMLDGFDRSVLAQNFNFKGGDFGDTRFVHLPQIALMGARSFPVALTPIRLLNPFIDSLETVFPIAECCRESAIGESDFPIHKGCPG